jgi:hypothetical protein
MSWYTTYMQPNRPDSPENWQQPSEQPSQSPYTAPAPISGPQQPSQPVVTLTPEEPEVSPSPLPVQPQPSSEVPLSNESPDVSSQPVPEEEPVHWQAQEYIHHEKNTGWFIAFGLAVFALMAIAIFLMQSITFAVLIPVMAVALIVYVRRPPRMLDYTLSSKGLYINDELYPFADFKGFGVIHDGKEYSVMLIPLKRFRLGVSVYFPEEAGEAIVDLLGSRLPMQELRLDAVDRVLRKLRI